MASTVYETDNCRRDIHNYVISYYMALSHKDWELPNSRI